MRRPVLLTRTLLVVLSCAVAAGACGDDDDALADAGDGKGGTGPQHVDLDATLMIDLEEPLPDAGTLPYDCRAGVMDSVDRNFLELEPGGIIPIGGTGQAGLVARLALRCTPNDEQPELDMASVDLLLINPFTGITAPRKPRPRGYDLTCRDDGGCEAVPILVEISHLAKLPELEGLPVRVDIAVRPLADDTVLLGQARSHGVFQRQ